MVEAKTRKALRLRAKVKKRKPAFVRQEGYRYVKLKKVWRKPRGRKSKLRRYHKSRGSMPNPGYCSPVAARGLSSSGFVEVLVSNPDGIAKIDKEKQAAVISSSVGKKKRMEIIDAAEKAGVRVLNGYKAKLRGF